MMAGRLWFDPEDAGVTISAFAARLRLPRIGADGMPDADDAVLSCAAKRIGERPAFARTAAWVLDGCPALRTGDEDRLQRAGLKLVADWAAAAAVREAGGRHDLPRGAYVTTAAAVPLTAYEAAAGRLFEVPVFHLEPLAVRRIGPGAGRLPADWDSRHPLYRRLCGAAVRALYAAGRDFGVVRLTAADDGGVRVCSRPFAPPDADDAPLWLDALRRFQAELAADYAARSGRAARMRRSEHEGDGILIGADPEFVLQGPDGRVVPADRFFTRHAAAGSDSVRAGGRLIYPVAELRPDPAADPAGLARNIRRLMKRAAAATADTPLQWLAGGMPVPGLALGGHLHLSGVRLSARLLRVLDSCLALPLAAAEDPRGRSRRPRYGALGDFRRQPHGGFEYRTPPSWLVSPAAAQAAFAIALLAARDYWALAACGLPGETAAGIRAYYDGDTEVLREFARSTHGSMRAMPSYGAYARWIEPFFAAIEAGAVWDERADIRPKWGL